jgi:hypothetical protein
MSTNIILIKSNFYLNLNKYVTREHSAVELSGSGRKVKECKKNYRNVLQVFAGNLIKIRSPLPIVLKSQMIRM